MSKTIWYDCSKGKHFYLPKGNQGDVCVICLKTKGNDSN